MAKDKKGFVLYADLLHTVKKLPKDKQAELFVLILEYVNDLNPEVEDLLLEIAFEPIKRQLKRDLQKYESRAERSRQNGKLGGRPKKPKKPSGLKNNLENLTEPKKPDTVTDIVTDTVIDIKGDSLFISFKENYPKESRTQEAEFEFYQLPNDERKKAVSFIPKYKTIFPDYKFQKKAADYLKSYCWHDKQNEEPKKKLNYLN